MTRSFAAGHKRTPQLKQVDDASFKTKLKHKFHEHGNNVWSVAKTAWSVV